MIKQFLTVSIATVALAGFMATGCSSKPKLESPKSESATVEETEQKTEDTLPAVQPPASDKPKDHPAH